MDHEAGTVNHFNGSFETVNICENEFNGPVLQLVLPPVPEGRRIKEITIHISFEDEGSADG